MNYNEDVLEVYGSISMKTTEMLDSAKQGDWDRLVALEQDYGVLVARLKCADADAPAATDADFARRKMALIRKVLADDAEIRRYTEPWMHQLDVYLGTARQQRQLQRAYQTD
jgi:flagellar protein FliT